MLISSDCLSRHDEHAGLLDAFASFGLDGPEAGQPASTSQMPSGLSETDFTFVADLLRSAESGSCTDWAARGPWRKLVRFQSTLGLAVRSATLCLACHDDSVHVCTTELGCIALFTFVVWAWTARQELR